MVRFFLTMPTFFSSRKIFAGRKQLIILGKGLIIRKQVEHCRRCQIFNGFGCLPILFNQKSKKIYFIWFAGKIIWLLYAGVSTYNFGRKLGKILFLPLSSSLGFAKALVGLNCWQTKDLKAIRHFDKSGEILFFFRPSFGRKFPEKIKRLIFLCFSTNWSPWNGFCFYGVLKIQNFEYTNLRSGEIFLINS